MNTTTHTFKRIAINTGGGDAPGLNAVIHAVVNAGHTHGWEIHGIRDGLDGLLHPDSYPDGGVIKLTRSLVRNIANLGGTILGTSRIVFENAAGAAPPVKSLFASFKTCGKRTTRRVAKNVLALCAREKAPGKRRDLVALLSLR